jgi:hypothetical protein
VRQAPSPVEAAPVRRRPVVHGVAVPVHLGGPRDRDQAKPSLPQVMLPLPLARLRTIPPWKKVVAVTLKPTTTINYVLVARILFCKKNGFCSIISLSVPCSCSRSCTARSAAAQTKQERRANQHSWDSESSTTLSVMGWRHVCVCVHCPYLMFLVECETGQVETFFMWSLGYIYA